MRLRLRAPFWGFASAFVMVCAVGSADAQPAKKPLKSDKTEPAPVAKPETKKDGKSTKPAKEQNFNFDNLNLNGRSRSPQLLYFLERANEELERASLEKRSFIPHMVRSLDEEAL
jgi:hypothetical protein